jgi:hypothetical protein
MEVKCPSLFGPPGFVQVSSPVSERPQELEGFMTLGDYEHVSTQLSEVSKKGMSMLLFLIGMYGSMVPGMALLLTLLLVDGINWSNPLVIVGAVCGGILALVPIGCFYVFMIRKIFAVTSAFKDCVDDLNMNFLLDKGLQLGTGCEADRRYHGMTIRVAHSVFRGMDPISSVTLRPDRIGNKMVCPSTRNILLAESMTHETYVALSQHLNANFMKHRSGLGSFLIFYAAALSAPALFGASAWLWKAYIDDRIWIPALISYFFAACLIVGAGALNWRGFEQRWRACQEIVREANENFASDGRFELEVFKDADYSKFSVFTYVPKIRKSQIRREPGGPVSYFRTEKNARKAQSLTLKRNLPNGCGHLLKGRIVESLL